MESSAQTPSRMCEDGPSAHGTDDGVAVPRHWYVAQVRMHCERRVVLAIKDQVGVETYLPQRTEVHKWSDRNKKVQRNLLPMMVFVRATAKEIDAVNRLPQVYRLLRAPGSTQPAVIPDEQLARFQYMVGNCDHDLLIAPPAIVKGAAVRIARGPMKGLEGIATTDAAGHTRLTITINPLCNASVTVPLNDLEPVAK